MSKMFYKTSRLSVQPRVYWIGTHNYALSVDAHELMVMLLLAADSPPSTAAVVLVSMMLATLQLLVEHSTTVLATVPPRVVELCTKFVTVEVLSMEPEENFLTNISEWAELADFFQRCV